MHPRVAISALCFPTLPAVDAIEVVADLGSSSTSIPIPKLRVAGVDAVAEASRRCGVRVVAVPGGMTLRLSNPADLRADVERALETIDIAAGVGATSVYTLTGRRPAAEWDVCVDAYAQAVAELVEHAATRGVTLALEPVNWLYADMSFVHTFHDALEVGRAVGMGVCLDLFHTWMERDLREDIETRIADVVHVQLGDFVFGDRTLPSRAVLGEGDLPLATIVRWLLDAGYQGVFDCEVNGPHIDAIGHREAATRSAAWLDALLVELGA